MSTATSVMKRLWIGNADKTDPYIEELDLLQDVFGLKPPARSPILPPKSQLPPQNLLNASQAPTETPINISFISVSPSHALGHFLYAFSILIPL
ncbi:hypothetical protein BDZ94DRAFT_1303625 [Collybia nuda]|uniref:Uncharacterized protein n=1 Tax=Collybia nuda TaxID=64659 RepID=A0A9P5YJP1_9AGAR|nr:hypothetical protein BDZ94DRAFT_1303625 [Collybia nuda]